MSYEEMRLLANNVLREILRRTERSFTRVTHNDANPDRWIEISATLPTTHKFAATEAQIDVVAQRMTDEIARWPEATQCEILDYRNEHEVCVEVPARGVSLRLARAYDIVLDDTWALFTIVLR